MSPGFLETVMVWLIVTSIAAAGVWLIRRGWLGRRIDDHPLCRRCGFDLYAKPETSTRCAECGADLGIARAIRIGHRRRRAVWIATGAALFLPLIVALGASLFGVHVDWIKHEPAWLLASQTESADVHTRDDALNELL